MQIYIDLYRHQLLLFEIKFLLYYEWSEEEFRHWRSITKQ
jgi:hypothetical protein